MDHLQNVMGYFDQQQPLCAEHDRISKDLYKEFGVKAGLRDENGKGVLVAPTVHGNLLVGPNAEPVEGNDTSCTSSGLEFVKTTAQRSVPSINVVESIRGFAGVRANLDVDDFIIGEEPEAPGWIDLAGMKSPGLSAAPAVAEEAVAILKERGVLGTEKADYKDGRRHIRFKELSAEEKAALVKEQPAYGRVICRCETITEGEILLAGPTVMKEYMNNPEETARTLRKHDDGLTWVYTGDLGTMDDQGFIYFKGRAKRMIITSGYNVYPGQLENILDAHEDVQMSCIIGVPDPYKMQKVKAFVMLKPGVPANDATKQTLLDYCRKHVAKYAMPYDIEFRDELPKTLVGKVAYRVLEDEEKARIAAQAAQPEA